MILKLSKFRRNLSLSRPHGVIDFCFQGDFPSLQRAERARNARHFFSQQETVTTATSMFVSSSPPTTKKVGNQIQAAMPFITNVPVRYGRAGEDKKTSDARGNWPGTVPELVIASRACGVADIGC